MIKCTGAYPGVFIKRGGIYGVRGAGGAGSAAVSPDATRMGAIAWRYDGIVQAPVTGSFTIAARRPGASPRMPLPAQTIQKVHLGCACNAASVRFAATSPRAIGFPVRQLQQIVVIGLFEFLVTIQAEDITYSVPGSIPRISATCPRAVHVQTQIRFFDFVMLPRPAVDSHPYIAGEVPNSPRRRPTKPGAVHLVERRKATATCAASSFFKYGTMASPGLHQRWCNSVPGEAAPYCASVSGLARC